MSLEKIADPLELFTLWLGDAGKSEPNDPNAMALATVGDDGYPMVRVVLLKGFDDRGFVFYTNFNSHKGQHLLKNPRAALCFYWKSCFRQIRIEGDVTPVSNAEADEYFKSRPKGSQIGAWASLQSEPLESRDVLERRVTELEREYADTDDIPRPSHWSGFRVTPKRYEFWQAGEYRLHDRFEFTTDGAGSWQKRWLYP